MPVTVGEVIRVIKDQQLASEQDLAAVSPDHRDIDAWVKSAVDARIVTAWQGKQLLLGRKRFTLGKYQLLQKLSDRAPQSSFLARHRQMGRTVELVVSPTDADTGKFLKNAGRLAKIDHPNLQHTFDFDVEGSRSYLVLEHIAGRKINEFHGPLQIGLVVDFAKQIVAGIGYLHDRGFVHGELHPSNILVDKNNRIRIERINAIVDPNKNARPTDDICAVGQILSKLCVAPDDDVHRQFDELVAQIIDDESISAQVVAERLARLNVPALETQSADSTTRNPSSDSGSELKESESKKNSSSDSIPWSLIAVIVVGLVVSLFGIGTLAFVLTQREHQTVVQKEASDRWWENDDPVGTDKAEPTETALPDNQQVSPKDSNPDAIDLGNVGVNQTDTNVKENPDTEHQGLEQVDPSAKELNDEADDDGEKPMEKVVSAEPTVEDVETPSSDGSSPESDPRVSPPINPFRQLANQFTLALSSDKRIQSLGDLDIGIDLELELVGSEVAHLSNIEYLATPSDQRGVWRVETISGERDIAMIAQISTDNGELQFQWTDKLTRPVLANHLCNCVLRLKSGEFKHDIVLRGPPTELPILVVSCDGRVSQRAFSIHNMPSLNAVSFEVLELGPQFEAPTIAPDSAAYGEVISITSRTKGATPIRFELSIGKRRELAVTANPYLLNESNDEWLPLTRRGFQSIGVPIVAANRALPETKRRLEAIRRRASKSLTRQQREDLKAEHDAAIRLIKAAHAKYEATSALCRSLNQKGQVRIRIFYTVEEFQIDLGISAAFHSDGISTSNAN